MRNLLSVVNVIVSSWHEIVVFVAYRPVHIACYKVTTIVRIIHLVYLFNCFWPHIACSKNADVYGTAHKLCHSILVIFYPILPIVTFRHKKKLYPRLIRRPKALTSPDKKIKIKYTDASKTKDDKAGVGIYITQKQVNISLSTSNLSRISSTELVAIEDCLVHMKDSYQGENFDKVHCKYSYEKNNLKIIGEC